MNFQIFFFFLKNAYAQIIKTMIMKNIPLSKQNDKRNKNNFKVCKNFTFHAALFEIKVKFQPLSCSIN